MKVVNLCPHTVRFNSGLEFPPSGDIARVKTSYSEPVGELNIMEVEFGEIEGLPEPRPTTLYIVSGLVLQAAKACGRTDCVAPATGHPKARRDESGQIIAVPGFVH